MSDELDLDAIEATAPSQCLDGGHTTRRLVAELRAARETITDITARMAAFIEEDGMSARISFKAANAALRRAEAAEAERDALRAKIEAARAALDEPVPFTYESPEYWPLVSRIQRVRAALGGSGTVAAPPDAEVQT